ncbi:uncharacterized protein LOC110894119 isoform X5 [Helianthus annuus]|uniref:uncharacterized protein LOC110894119 isoform X5 n=1 Tax=Helianthus annuus TaxID=4232 RepID=UPI000B8F3F4F|nr:uncharacterized protein LOC110894119 isoform X5 [Helianthus annuus]
MVKAPTPLMSSLTQRRRCHGLPMKMLKGVNTSVCRFMLNSKYMYRMVKTTDRAPASSGQFIFAKTLHPGIIMMICYLTFVTHEPKNDQLKDRGRSRFYQEKYYQYGAILQGVKYIENEQCS